jgi:hypothetical protein
VLLKSNEKESYLACPRKKLFGYCERRMPGSPNGEYYKREYILSKASAATEQPSQTNPSQLRTE